MAESTETTEARRRTLEVLRPDAYICVDQKHAIMSMAIRYGQARAAQADQCLDYETASRARDRRFAALQRLVYGW